MKGLLIFSILIAISYFASAQSRIYGPSNIHAHNDYDKPEPFRNAYGQRAGSIEADIFLVNGDLLLAHTLKEVKKDKSLEAIYLRPLDSLIKRFHGQLTEDSAYHLQLLIDLKSEALTTLPALIALLQKYPGLTGCKRLSFVVSGNRPPVASFQDYPTFIQFDGLPDTVYTPGALARVPMISDNFKTYSTWSGKGPIPVNDLRKIQAVIEHCRKLGKPIRFWNAPDQPEAWRLLTDLKADWINTDQVSKLSAYLHKQAPIRLPD
jgi:alkaline phosphatase